MSVTSNYEVKRIENMNEMNFQLDYKTFNHNYEEDLNYYPDHINSTNGLRTLLSHSKSHLNL